MKILIATLYLLAGYHLSHKTNESLIDACYLPLDSTAQAAFIVFWPVLYPITIPSRC